MASVVAKICSGLLVQKQMIIPEMRTRDVPMEVLRFHVKREHVRKQDIKRARDIADGIHLKIGRGIERRHAPRFHIGTHCLLLFDRALYRAHSLMKASRFALT
jgi:hypothetical protein